jgi:ABC-type nitrate/sulfonate/bicarbonate transport system substrate-binding protein
VNENNIEFGAQGLVVGSLLLMLARAQAETVVATATGSPNAIGWPFYVALKKGFFAVPNITIDVVAADISLHDRRSAVG